MLTQSQSVLVAVFIQALLYGIYLATFVLCFRWLIFTDEGWNPRQNINPVMMFATIFIFLMFTISLGTELEYVLLQYIRKDEGWYKSEYRTVMASNIPESLVAISIDGVLIYRCWVVYAKSWLAICVPATFWLASLVCSALFSYYCGLNYQDQTYSTELAQIGEKTLVGLYTCNIAITVYATTAIICRILSSRRSCGSNPKRLNYVMRILAESGILYTSMLIFSLIAALLATHNNINVALVGALIIDISNPISFYTGGISFNLMLIRAYQGRDDHSADSRDWERAMSETQSNSNPQTTASMPHSNGRRLMRWIRQSKNKAIEEILEHRRSREGMHEN